MHQNFATNVAPKSSWKPTKPAQKRMVRVSTTVRIDVEMGAVTIPGETVNVSPSGVCFKCNELLEPQDTVHLILYMPEGKRDFGILRVAAEAVWNIPSEEGFLVAARFTAFAPGDQRRIREWLLSIMKPSA